MFLLDHNVLLECLKPFSITLHHRDGDVTCLARLHGSNNAGFGGMGATHHLWIAFHRWLGWIAGKSRRTRVMERSRPTGASIPKQCRAR